MAWYLVTALGQLYILTLSVNGDGYCTKNGGSRAAAS
jgi:hypothetical protein